MCRGPAVDLSGNPFRSLLGFFLVGFRCLVDCRIGCLAGLVVGQLSSMVDGMFVDRRFWRRHIVASCVVELVRGE